MSQKLFSTKALEKKQVVELKKGSVVEGRITFVFHPENKNIDALVIFQKDHCLYATRDSIKTFTSDVIIVEEFVERVEKEQQFYNHPVITLDGRQMGSVRDMAVDESGTLQEILVDLQKSDSAKTIDCDQVARIGDNVIFLKDDVYLYQYALSEEKNHKNDDSNLKYEEFFDQMTRRVSGSVNDFGSKVSQKFKHLEKESFSQDMSRFTDAVNREVGKFIDGIMEQISGSKKDLNQQDIDAVLNDVKGQTVRKSISDKQGNVIIFPGQIINEERVRSIMQADKIAELYRMATPLDEDDANDV